MPYQNIDVTVLPADVAAIKASFDAVLAKLPFLVNLTQAERKSIPKVGEGSVGYVQDAVTGTQNFPTILPGSFDAAGFKKDADLFALLTELGTIAASVVERIDDTRMAVGSEAMREASLVYKYAKDAQTTTPGIKPLVDKLAQRYAKLTGPKHPAAPSTPPA